jgi:hypothetical protein
MGVHSPLDIVLRRAAQAVGVYQVPPLVIALAAAGLARIPAPARSDLQAHIMISLVLGIAETHQTDCLPPGCATCDALGNALAVALAAIRVEIDSTFERRLAGGDPTTPAW